MADDSTSDSTDVSPRIIDIEEPKKVQPFKISPRSMEHRRKCLLVLKSLTKITTGCENLDYPSCEVGTSSEGEREIVWPGVRVQVVYDEIVKGSVAKVVPTAKRFRVLERHPLCFDLGSEKGFTDLIKTIGEHVLFRTSSPILIVSQESPRRKSHYGGFTLPVKPVKIKSKIRGYNSLFDGNLFRLDLDDSLDEGGYSETI